MKATIDGITFEGTPQEIAEFVNIVMKNEVKQVTKDIEKIKELINIKPIESPFEPYKYPYPYKNEPFIQWNKGFIGPYDFYSGPTSEDK